MRKQNVLRILALLIAMVMMLAVVACNKKDDKPETTTKTEDSSTTPKETEPTETEPTETEPTESEPTESEPTESEPTESEPTESEPTESEPTESEPTETEPTGAEPPTETEPTETKPDDDPTDEPCETHDFGNRFEKKWGICVVCGYVDDNHEHALKDGACIYCEETFEATPVASTFDNDGDGEGDVFYFTPALPEKFTGEDVIWLDAYNGSTGNHMTYDEIDKNSGTLPYPHVYCSDQVVTDSIAFTITVDKAGLYDVAAHYRIKDQKTRGAKFIANEGTEFEYAVNHTYGWTTADDAYAVRNNDFLIGAYMTGLVLPLQEGENTITIRVADGIEKSQHFRDLYLVWSADLPEEEIPECETHDFGNRFEKKWGICVVCGYVDENHEHALKDGACIYCEETFEATPVASTFDNDGDGEGDVFYFTPALPEEFTGEDVIWLDAYNGSTGSHMTYDEIDKNSGTLPYPHVYNSDMDTSNSIAFTVTVEKAGIYDVAVHYRIKDQKTRGAKFVINQGTENEQVINHTYGWTTADEAYAVRNNDFLIGSYMTGLSFELQEGENTITILVADGIEKSQHFRDLYLVWSADLPAADVPAVEEPAV